MHDHGSIRQDILRRRNSNSIHSTIMEDTHMGRHRTRPSTRASILHLRINSSRRCHRGPRCSQTLRCILRNRYKCRRRHLGCAIPPPVRVVLQGRLLPTRIEGECVSITRTIQTLSRQKSEVSEHDGSLGLYCEQSKLTVYPAIFGVERRYAD